MVSTIQTFGGTMLGTSRGPQNINEMVDGLEELGIDILFVIGGDGTLKGAAALVAEIHRRGLRKSVIGIPKTIDNDIRYLDKSFGFETAFAEAVKAVSCAHVEAICVVNGIGLGQVDGARIWIHCLLCRISQPKRKLLSDSGGTFRFAGTQRFPGGPATENRRNANTL